MIYLFNDYLFKRNYINFISLISKNLNLMIKESTIFIDYYSKIWKKIQIRNLLAQKIFSSKIYYYHY